MWMGEVLTNKQIGRICGNFSIRLHLGKPYGTSSETLHK